MNLIEALRELGPFFVGFLLSFVVTAIAWAAHRDLFALIRRTDRTLVWRNILYLLPLRYVERVRAVGVSPTQPCRGSVQLYSRRNPVNKNVAVIPAPSARKNGADASRSPGPSAFGATFNLPWPR
jgi:hypothetical protein